MTRAPACAGGAHAVEGVALEDIAARFGTPTYVYSRAAIESRYDGFGAALAAAPAHLVCYAVKANSNLAVLNVLCPQGRRAGRKSPGESSCTETEVHYNEGGLRFL